MKVRKIILLLSFLLSSIILKAQVKTVHRYKQRTPLASSMERGKLVYKNICLACHMADGGGVQNMNPPLTNTDYVLGDKAMLIKIVLNGFKEDVEINGQKYSNNMTPHKDLKDQQIADVLTYVRKSFGNNASAVTVTQVAAARAANTGK